MPRFLNTWTGEFEWHDPKEVRYAILSHVWQTPEEGGEQTFDDVRRFQADVKAAREEPGGPYPAHWSIFDPMNTPFPCNPSGIFSELTLYDSLPDGVSVIFSEESPLSAKIKGFCKVARDAGFHLVWNDTCCIDKSSSAELSEAINSMYEWYRLSDICYVYLVDVPDHPGSNLRFADFSRSKWHSRGWTLQELVAPERIEFLSRGWKYLETKLGLAGTLAEITKIDVNILLGRAPVNSASVAERMSWAARRQTTRVEDRAYSLMGLFGVHMSPIYGEGTNAFLRLQEELIRTIPDQSIFAWGMSYSRSIDSRSFSIVVRGDDEAQLSGLCLLAPSPSAFLLRTVRRMSRLEFATRLHLQGPEDVPPLDCAFSPQGARMRLLCLNLMEVGQHCHIQLMPGVDEQQPCRDPAQHREADRLALLQCEDYEGRLVALPFRSSDTVGGGGSLQVGIHCNFCPDNIPYRTILLSREVLAEVLKRVKPVTAELSIIRHRSDPPRSKLLLPDKSLPTLSLWPGDRPDGVAFSLSPDSLANLRILGITASPLQIARKEEHRVILEFTLALRDGDLLQTIRLRLSLERRKLFYDRSARALRCDNIRFRFSCAASLSPGLVSSSGTAVSGSEKDLEVLDSDSAQIQEEDTNYVHHRSTLVQFDLLIRPYPQRPRQARLLRLSLERGPDGQPGTVLLVMRMSEEHDNASEGKCAPNVGLGDTTTEDADRPSANDSFSNLVGDSAQSSTLTNVPGAGCQSPGATTTQGASLAERVDALGRENNALREQVLAATSKHAEMESMVAALASQNTALQAQMAAVLQRLDALAPTATATSSQVPARADAA